MSTSSYTLQCTLLDDSSCKLAHVWGSFSHKVPWQFFKLFDNVGKVLHADIFDGIPCLFEFFDLTLVLRARAVTNPFPDLPNFPFESEDVVSILFRLSNFAETFKVTILSLPLISLCFLTVRRPQIFMFTDWNKSFLPVKFSSQNVLWVEQPWKIDGGVTTTRNFMLISWNWITKLWAKSSYFLYLCMVFFQHYFHLEQHCFHLDRQFSCSPNISNWLSQVPTQSSLVSQNSCSSD